MSLVERILAVLPQTQCTRCGYPDCAGYAKAIVRQEASINQCPPGGHEGIKRLAKVTGLEELPLNPLFGTESPRHVAWIDEAWCIGCTLCIDVCPTDAIIGVNKQMHTVVESLCTGCELCLPVCPVDCIHLENISGNKTAWNAWSEELADQSKTRYFQKQQRLEQQTTTEEPLPSKSDIKQKAVQAALLRAKQRQSK